MADNTLRFPQLDKALPAFRHLFKGRDDLVARYWKSREKGTSGYSPICANEWKKGLCRKGKTPSPCQGCPHADYTPWSEKLLQKHFSGRHILGVYPLKPDGTCHFLAADFDQHDGDGKDPINEVLKFYGACQRHRLPSYVLRSKSGKGYHVYLFFASPVSAAKARTAGFALLEEAGVSAQKGDSAFDRLFPNQAVLSGKKFGNLIALPWQGKALKKGHTVFLDPGEGFKKPYQDQGKILAAIEKIPESALDLFIKEGGGLKTESPAKPEKESGLSIFSYIKNSCGFIEHCQKDAETLPEPEWYAMLTISVRCEDGHKISHKLSEPYPKYSQSETNAKIGHALMDTGPYTCAKIKEINPAFCERCRHWGTVKSPILLGAPQSGEHNLIARMNSEHAVVMIGGKCVVMNEIIDPAFNRPDISLSSKTDFFDLYAHKLVPHPAKKEKVSIAKIWWKSPKRRQYKGIVFEPGREVPDYYNLWRGFAVAPKKGDWSLYRDLVENVIAGGEKERAKWILSWMARIIQDLGGERPGTSLVLQGGMGTGKGTFVNLFGSLFGRHYLQLANPMQVVGRFNGHLKDALLVFVDEGFWAGDKTAEGVIKNMVTETILNIEQKGKDIFQIKNHVNLIIASNNSWVVPAGHDERRFFVMRVSEHRRQDKAYFRAIHAQMQNGGLEALLYDLMHMDIKGVDLRTFEKTEALFEQKIASMDTVKKYWLERLKEGNLVRYGGDWKEGITPDYQYKDYLEFASELNDRHPKCKEQFNIELNRLCPGIKNRQKRVQEEMDSAEQKRIRVKLYPDLQECRQYFERILQMEIKWEGVDD